MANTSRSLAKLVRSTLFAALLLTPAWLHAEGDVESTGATDDGWTLPNLPLVTGGGMQFWADEWLFRDWRIQRNTLTGHCRLLDGGNCRRAWGSFDACKARLDEVRRERNLPPMQGKAVIVVHGLFRTRASMESLCEALEQQEEYSVFAIGYPTTRASVAEHADSLDRMIRSLEGIEEINFVCHSLGNLVVRHWLRDMAEEDRTLPPGQQFGRMVMLGPPNHQPRIAEQLLSNRVATFVAGPAAEQLAIGWSDLEAELSTPAFEFAIVAGGKGDDDGYNPLLPGDDDGVVTVASTRLARARDFRRLPVLHSFMMNDAEVQKLTLSFLKRGYFEADQSRQPILVPDVTPEMDAKR